MIRSAKVVLQSGVLPYRVRKSGKVEILLVATGHFGRWGIPKGHAEPQITLAANAVKEAFEEAGPVTS